ncbi:MAG: D-glycero-beta-D-manno-heptose 1,7-bisphosphate 7-phosphatase [Lachnospiraceae bacterium]|nr:D-glycero-beta-D-manno-heptose 1,7-bisphosphate 7-phosphatase [Butyrivibrio sp.]MCM1343394.1 D-glycero-beta-D-manno-heptose 1,7-bisphosphate 7-phosphatase [Muribaculaceae bacterium]MCM1410563.1 D-glycero-beta-D-manno-heptose 1,7-bisphosphate 7-phosphatase [Lachnospiraceae bacterium]
MNKAVFLDRDGTINIDKGYVFQREQFEYINGVTEALRLLGELGYQLVIVTNQSGIARGYYTIHDFEQLNDWMLSDLKKRGIEIAGIYYCPHHPRGRNRQYAMECDCRKPKTGLFWRAQKELQIDMEHSYAVGDRIRDLCICGESNVQGILLYDLKSNYVKLDVQKEVWRCHDLAEAARRIAQEDERGDSGNVQLTM